MARLLYAASTADFAADVAPITNLVSIHPSAVLSVYTTATGGSAETDLLAEDGVTAVSVVTCDVRAGFRFYGKDNYTGTYWLETDGFKRYRCDPVGMPERLAICEAYIAGIPALIDAAVQEAIDSAGDNAILLMNTHLDNADPHPVYPRMRGGAAGADIWGAVSAFPTSDGLGPIVDGAYVIVGG